jgi:Double-GTPase 2
MKDLAARMIALRDQRGLQIGEDGIILLAAKDSKGTFESLDSRFRMAGLPQSPAVLRVLVDLRAEALSEPGSHAVNGLGRSAPPAPPAPPAQPDSDVADPWSPPSWYMSPHSTDEQASAPAPAAADSSVPAEVEAAALPPVPPAPTSTQPPRPVRDRTRPTPSVSPVVPEPDARRLPPVELFSPSVDAFGSTDGRLVLRASGDGLVARWLPVTPVAAQTVVYLVCCAKSGVPRSPDEGQRLIATTTTTVALPNLGQYYAVFAYPVHDFEQLPAATAHRHAVGRRLPEVDDLEVVGEVHGVLLTWKRPRAIDRVQVMRSLPNEELPDVLDKSLLMAFTGDGFRDETAEPGAQYQYKVYTESAGLGAASGDTESSPGLVRTVKVPAAPSEVKELDGRVVLRQSDPGVELGWASPARGVVRIYQRRGEPNVETSVGTVQTAGQFATQETLLGARIGDPAVIGAGSQRLPWIPLDLRDHGTAEPRWTFTAVSEFADQFVIGAQKVITYVGDVGEAAIDERVDWQLLRASWPAGASFLGVWHLGPDEEVAGTPHRRVTKDEFERFGGISLALTYLPQDVVVQAATKYGDEWVTGKHRRIHYPGRWVIRWDLASAGRFNPAKSLRVFVERPDWPGIGLSLLSSERGLPLTPQDPELSIVHQASLPATALIAGQWMPASPDLRLPRHGFIRMFAASGPGIAPIVIDPIPTVKHPIVVREPAALRCPRCLIGGAFETQYFRCQGVCPDEPDWAKGQLLNPGTAGARVVDKPVFAVGRPVSMVRNRPVLAAPSDHAQCPRPDCQAISHRQVCPYCHSDLPPNWWAHDVKGVVVVGARSSGKTTYLSVLTRHLEKNLLPLMHGYLHPVDAVSQAKLDAMRRGVDDGRLERSTLGTRSNLDVLDPMVANILVEPAGRTRSLAIFDVAGEDMTESARVQPYSPALAGADLLLILVDPLQLDGIREWLQGSMQLPAQGIGVPAATVVQNVVQQIRRQRGVPAGRLPMRAAVAFSKFDGLQKAAQMPNSAFANLIGPGNALWRDPYAITNEVYREADGQRVHDEVRALLQRVGESALISSVEASFSDVRYFALSALGHGPRGQQLSDTGASPLRVGDPIRWLLAESGWA